jgi:hypothetical protein
MVTSARGRVRGLQHQTGNEYPKGGNSGTWGIYEVADTAGWADSHNMGGLYSRITPKVKARKAGGRVADDGHHAVRSALLTVKLT